MFTYSSCHATTNKKATPFFTELGNLLNLVRNFNTLLNNATEQQHITDNGLSNAWYQTNPLVSKIQNRVSELESEIAYFFTDYSTYKTTGSRFNMDIIQQKLLPNFRKICNEYFSLSTNSTYNQIFEIETDKEKGIIYQMNRKKQLVVN